MKKIEAYVKTDRLIVGIDRLHAIEGLTGARVHEIRGFGRARDSGGPVRIVDNTLSWVPHVKVEIVSVISSWKPSLARSPQAPTRACGPTGRSISQLWMMHCG